jgi:glycosyltransferase involved in cell wall biosynthesis
MPHRLGYPALNDYNVLLANSEYTAGWIRRYYGRESELSYPPIDTVNFVPLAKERIMLSVGRFEPKAMSKRHDALIEVFRSLYEEGSLEGWRMIVCGGNDGTPEFTATVQFLRNLSRGLPVTIEENVPFARLCELYGTASVYLHAMGLDEDPETVPWRFEHFGMTTVEAMSAGAVPFVLAAGGQREIVINEKCGFLWHSRDELKQQLRAFTKLGASDKRRLRDAARERSQDFSETVFIRRTRETYRRLGIDCAE